MKPGGRMQLELSDPKLPALWRASLRATLAGVAARRVRFFFAIYACAVTACHSNVAENVEFPKRLATCTTVAFCRALIDSAEEDVRHCDDKKVYTVVQKPSETHLTCADAEENRSRLKARLAIVEKDEAQARATEDEERRQQRDLQLDKQRQAVQSRIRDAEQEPHLRLLSLCEKNAELRSSRARHLEMIANHPDAFVRRECKAQTERRIIAAECKDANGFSRPCQKSVAGEVTGYTCSPSLDQELVHLGLYELGMEEYPYEEERRVAPDDTACAAAKMQLKRLQFNGGSGN